MYVRTKATPLSPRRSVQIVEGKRVGKKVKQIIVRYVGVAMSDKEEQTLKDLGEEIIAQLMLERKQQSKQQDMFPVEKAQFLSHVKNKGGRPRRKRIEDILPPSQVTLDDIEEIARVTEGMHEVGGAVFDSLYKGILPQKRAYKCLKDLVLARIVYPVSKHRLQQKLASKFAKDYSLDAIYRVMDKIYPKIDQIKQKTFNKTRGLFPEQIDLLFFDVTTLYFESIATDGLREFGYSKDHRFNTTQVVLALATNQDGLPVGYELFSGNTAEVKTLAVAIEKWKKLFRIKDVCFVADRAMFSKANLALLEERGYKYVVAAKLKSLSETKQQEILQEQNYKPTILNNSFAWTGEFMHENRRLIVSYKTKRALKDKKDRQKILDKLEKIIGNNGTPAKLISNKGVKQFVTVNKNSTAFVDQDKIAAAASWDGLHGVITNITDEQPEAIIARYARLWVIEESFRVNKHQLQMRPIFHFKPERICAHIAICYMAFAVLRNLQYRANLMQKVSIDTILEELQNVQASIYQHKKTKDLYRVPSSLSNTARKIYKSFYLERSLNAEIYLP